jgi:uncharacterized protein
MIAGSVADTRYFSEDGIKLAKEPKELFIIPNMTYIDISDHTDETIPKLVDFMATHLAA